MVANHSQVLAFFHTAQVGIDVDQARAYGRAAAAGARREGGGC